GVRGGVDAALRRVAAGIVGLLSGGGDRKTPNWRAREIRDCDRTTTACPGIAGGACCPRRHGICSGRISGGVGWPVKRFDLAVPRGQRIGASGRVAETRRGFPVVGISSCWGFCGLGSGHVSSGTGGWPHRIVPVGQWCAV